MRLYIEPRDAWVGYYRGETNHYVCVLPCIVFKWRRRVRKVDLNGVLGPAVPYPPGCPTPRYVVGGVVTYTDGSWVNAMTGNSYVATPALETELARRGWVHNPPSGG